MPFIIIITIITTIISPIIITYHSNLWMGIIFFILQRRKLRLKEF
jgi:hypothetical protein